MNAESLPLDTSIKAVSRQVNDPGIAFISNTGLVTAISNRTVTVKAKAINGSGTESTLDVMVTNPMDRVENLSQRTDNFVICPHPAFEGSFTIERIDKANQIKMVDLNGNTIRSFRVNNSSLKG
jgi:hypothetical protein